MSSPAEREPEPRAVRRAGGDVRRAPGTSGEEQGTTGAAPVSFWRGIAAIIPVLAVVCAINVLSHLHDAALAGRRLSVWEPITWEATSAASSLVACVVIWLALRLAPLSPRRWPRVVLAHAAGTVLFSAIHVAGMWALRMVIYAAAGSRYPIPLNEIVYEYGKDVLAYAGFAALFWLVSRVTFRSDQAQATPAPIRDDCFDIVDGARILRIPLTEILAVRAAGNYVEFLLRDGRRPLMRAPLGEIESTLEPAGFLRTHRSWVVNAASVRGLEPAGSGDYQLDLDGGQQAPVSRRFPRALERLKGGG
jgi:hypothetical protein